MKFVDKKLEELKVQLRELNIEQARQSFVVDKQVLLNELSSETQTRSIDDIKKDVDDIEKREKEFNDKVNGLQNQINMREEIAKKINSGQVEEINKREDGKNMDKRNILESLEYRNAFMDYVLKGKEIPTEYRADATTKTTDIGAVIPAPVMSKIIEKLKFYGNIYKRVTQTNFQGGLEIPISDLKPQATWVAEGVVSDKQKKEVKGTIVFAYHKLQCRVAVSLEADTVSLAVFEQTIQDNVYEAMIIAIEEAILNGSGTGQPLGITNDTKVASAQKITVKPSEIGKWKTWAKIFAKVPLSKRNGISLILNSETYESDIEGMVDDVGQPVARTNYGLNGEETYRFKGKEVLPVESYLPTFEVATAGAVFGVICNLKDYNLNSNMQMIIKRYFNDDTDEYITKATLIADGKLADAQGVILLVKGTDA